MKCLNCRKEIVYTGSPFGSGDFCGISCARSFSRKQSLTGTKKVNCIDCGKEIEVDKRAGSNLCKCDDCRKSKKLINYRNCKCCGKKLEHRGKFCDIVCQKKYQSDEYIKRWKCGLENGMSGRDSISDYIRNYLFEKFNNKCTSCNWGKQNSYTKKIPLEVEHKDGNYKNNKEENLDLLCPNCHSLTETYRGANKGHGREYRYKMKYAPVA